MKSLLLLLIFWSAPVFAVSSESARNEAQLILQEASQRTELVDRLDYFSRKFLSLPYGLNGPLGEGETGRYDQDPLYRFDTFDCTTFVETVLGLSRSVSVDQFESTMNLIRYRNGVVDYFERNHFPKLQWIPNNIANGFFIEINEQILPASKIKVSSTINDYGNWLLFAKLNVIQVPGLQEFERVNRLEELQSRANLYSPIAVSIPYLPIDELIADPKTLSTIPSGTVVSFVRVNWQLADKIGTNLLISHQGIIFQKNGETVLRHASSGAEKRVVEVRLLDYLKAIVPTSSLKGLHLLQPTSFVLQK